MPLFARKIIIPFYRKFYPLTSSAIDKIDKFETWILNKQIHFPNLEQLMPGISFSEDLINTYRFQNNRNKIEALEYLKQLYQTTGEKESELQIDKRIQKLKSRVKIKQ